MADELAGTAGGSMEGGGNAGAISAPVESAPAAAPAEISAPAAPDAANTVDTGEQPGGETAVNPNQALLDEIDNLGTDAEISQKSGDESTDALSDTNASDATITTDAGNTQSKEDKSETSGDESAKAETDGDTPDEIPDADWTKASQADEAYIEKHVPKAHLAPVRKLAKDARMARSFLNPNCPPDVFVTNLESKSKMRYGAVESEILKRNIESDPIAFLGKAFEATADESGNSESYQRLLDNMIGTNQEYVLEALKAKGLNLVEGEAGTAANADTARADLTKFSDEEIDGITDSAAFQQLQETFPEDAEKLADVLEATKQMRADAAQQAAEAEKAADPTVKDAERQVAEAQQATFTNDFSTVYETSVTNTVNSKLDKEYGLAVTPEEREKSPQMAFLKDAKKKLILAGGLDGSGDFDNDLYQWGQNRPAFKSAAKAMVEFTRAGEKDNAAASAKELAPFAEMFLAERLNSPQVKMVDEFIQILAKYQKASLESREDYAPASPLSPMGANGAPKSFMDEIDAMQ